MLTDVEMIREALRSVVDPELHLNIVDLGLVYAIEQPADGEVQITMTLTTPGCPIGTTLVQAVERVVAPLPGVKRVDVTLTFEPRWSPEFITEAGRAQLGFAI